MRVLVASEALDLTENVSMAIGFKWPASITDSVATAAEVLRMVRSESYHLVILDAQFPDRTGLGTLSELRRSSDVPVIMLASRVSISDRIRGLELGADAYMTKPVSLFELLARIEAIFRRRPDLLASVTGAYTTLEAGPIKLDAAKAEVRVSDRLVNLTPTEFRILQTLLQHSRRLVTPEILWREVWGSNGGLLDLKRVQRHVRSLRKKLTAGSSEVDVIATVRGMGYKVAA